MKFAILFLDSVSIIRGGCHVSSVLSIMLCMAGRSFIVLSKYLLLHYDIRGKTTLKCNGIAILTTLKAVQAIPIESNTGGSSKYNRVCR